MGQRRVRLGVCYVSMLEWASALGQELTRRSWFFCTAESCTGGLCAVSCTDLPGSSSWFAGGVIAYSYEMKVRLLGVPEDLLTRHGAVSLPVVRAMALGAAAVCGAECSLAISGVAGPSGGSLVKPVGTVCLAAALPADSGATLPGPEWPGWNLGEPMPGLEDCLKEEKAALFSLVRRFRGGRREVREQAASFGLQLLLELARGARPVARL